MLKDDVYTDHTTMTYRIAFVGPPGSGKGTQAELLAPVLGIPIIGPGALYRKEVAAGTPLGKEAVAIMSTGAMMPNALTNAMIQKRLRESDCAGGFILDGFPREVEQLRGYDELGMPFTHVILLAISEVEVMRRLADRLVCICGKQFNRRELQIEPGDEERCIACSGELTRRKDDNPETIQHRITLYHERTEAVVAECRQRGILVEVNGERPIADVHREILEKIGMAS